MSMTLCPLTTHLVEAPLFRLAVVPSRQNGLKEPSQVMIDKVSSVRVEKLHQKIGVLSPFQVKKIDEALRFWLDL